MNNKLSELLADHGNLKTVRNFPTAQHFLSSIKNREVSREAKRHTLIEFTRKNCLSIKECLEYFYIVISFSSNYLVNQALAPIFRSNINRLINSSETT